ncbi:hypothetical protein MXB_2100 [Myxobolus squamalis]|nr:hypothetical protein MXB_2100 [Myxobolus squamalis]
MTITAFAIFIVEKSSVDTGIYNITDSIYFTMTSFLTIGYGDIVPSNNVSRAFIVVLALIGVALTAVPSGIIGSGFALHAARKAKEKRGREIKKPASILLQRAIRNFLYQKDGSATEKIDFRTVLNCTKKNAFLIQAVMLKNRALEDTLDHSFEDTLLTKASINEAIQPIVWLDGMNLHKKES